MNSLPRLLKRLMADTHISSVLKNSPSLQKKTLLYLGRWLETTLAMSPQLAHWREGGTQLAAMAQGTAPDWDQLKAADQEGPWARIEKLYPKLEPQEQRALIQDTALRWREVFEPQKDLSQNRFLLPKIPPLKKELLVSLQRLKETENAVNELFGLADVGWDLESGAWKEADLAPLFLTAGELAKNKEIQRIAEILGRDYRSRFRNNTPPPASPPPKSPPSPHIGKEEIYGIRQGQDWGDLLTQEVALTAFPETQEVFFKKAAEKELLVWNYQAPTPPPRFRKKDIQTKKAAVNERGPVIVCLDTSGSMRGKPEAVAKTAAFAILKIALQEKRPCYLINFSAEIQTLEITNLRDNLEKLGEFLRFSFHGGTDLPKPLRYCLGLLEQKTWKEADVLIVSDFAVPKIPADLRKKIRKQQDNRDNRFYCLTISARPLNDWLNIFDGGWVYNINPHRPEGIDPKDVFSLS